MRLEDALYKDNAFLEGLESADSRRVYLKSLSKKRMLSLIGVPAALIAVLADWFSGYTVVILMSITIVHYHLDAKIKLIKWIDRHERKS
jgi:hypothetical protein